MRRLRAVLAVRQAVAAQCRVELSRRTPILVACSGGADSLALVAATVAVADGPVIGVTVDHGLQDGSAAVAERTARQMTDLGVAEAVLTRVQVDVDGEGVEAAARTARYAGLREVAARFDSDAVFLGHTFDDQAETVLLGLTRGSGGRSISGMPARFGVFRRPLLGVTRAQTEAACAAHGIQWWDDPHNSDSRFTRSRIRQVVLPMLERELGPGVAAALVRTADQVRLDGAALDALAETGMADYDPSVGFVVTDLAAQSGAVRTRMLRLAALAAGCPAGELFAVHIDALDRQVGNRDHLPKTIQLPGHVSAVRSENRLCFTAATAGCPLPSPAMPMPDPGP
ncbi:MAG: tRNA lysidine(34) synthetase TilS [Nocardioides sp.]